MYTTYVIHVKTAFHVRGVSRRFSDFSTLDRKLRAQYPNAPELVRSNRILGTLSPVGRLGFRVWGLGFRG